MHYGGNNININFGNQGIAPGGCYGGPRGPRGPQGQMMRMMQMMMQLMSRMMGGGHQNGGCCCRQSHPNFGAGFGGGFQGPGININMGASIRGFLG
jgi:hypothetical protein